MESITDARKYVVTARLLAPNVVNRDGSTDSEFHGSYADGAMERFLTTTGYVNPRMFAPPANVDDMDGCLRTIWHRTVTGWFEGVITSIEFGDRYVTGPAGPVGAGRSQFYLPTATPVGAIESSVPITWSGFPRSLLTLRGRAQALDDAEKLAYFGELNAAIPSAGLGPPPAFVEPRSKKKLRVPFRLQDEYLEWRTERDQNGRVTRVTFTCEGPEYWNVLAKADLDVVLALYRRYVNPAIRRSELCWKTDAVSSVGGRFKAGHYNPHNKWNTTHGIMHLTHWANTLSAQVNIAGSATILRHGIGTRYLTEAMRLTCGANFGDPNRASDPKIGSNVNAIAQTGAMVSLENPVGLYIDQIDANCVTDADGRPVPNYWRVLRGEVGVPGDPARPSRILRMEYTVPAGAGYTVGDLYVDGERITHGGQLAMHVHMKLIAVYYHDGRAPNSPRRLFASPYRLRTNGDFLVSFLATKLPKPRSVLGRAFEPAFASDALFGAGKPAAARRARKKNGVRRAATRRRLQP